MKREGERDQRELLAALNHPLRRRILRTLHGAGEARSSAELSKAFQMPVSKISYHVRVLHESHVVALTDRRRVRGNTEHFYVSTLAANELAAHLLELVEGEDGAS